MVSVKQILQTKYQEIDSRMSDTFSKVGVKYKPFAVHLEEEMEIQDSTLSSSSGDINSSLNEAFTRLLAQQNNPVSNIQASTNVNTSGAQKYEDIINAVAQKYGFSASLIKGIIQAESNFNPDCVSSAGAAGLMQLMPVTATEVGVTDRFDPEQNVDGGVQYIKKMLNRFNGDIKLALAAYNWGPAKVSALNITSSADLTKYNQIPEGVRKYVDRVLSYMLGFENAG